MLSIGFADALELIDRAEFPCGVLWTSEGHRVTFAALLRVLRSSHDAHPPVDPHSLPADAGERQDQE
jgi:hypothetical protein